MNRKLYMNILLGQEKASKQWCKKMVSFEIFLHEQLQL